MHDRHRSSRGARRGGELTAVDREIADLGGPAALPRRNGELRFNEPWEGRAFGIAVALQSTPPYPWSAFGERLARQIAEAGPDSDGTGYYERWLGALQCLLLDRGVVGQEELERRVREYREGRREDVS